MKLEVGKTYLTRDGNPITITGLGGHGNWNYEGELPNGDDEYWREDGLFYGTEEPHDWDLVSEVGTAVSPTVTVTVPHGVNVEIVYAS